MRGGYLWLVAVAACGSVQNSKPDAFVPIDAPALTSIALTGPNMTSIVAPPVQLTATGTYADGMMKDITSQATWTSSATSIATVAGGLATPVAVGTTTITAALDGKNSILNLEVGGTLVISNFGASSLVSLPASTNGTGTPLHTIVGATNTQLKSPRGITIVGTEVYVANQNGPSVTVYPIDGDGDIAPTRMISGVATTFVNPTDVEVFNNELYVGQLNGTVLVFPANATGNVAPTRSITFPGVTHATGLQIFNSELYVSDFVGTAAGQGQVVVVPVTASGATTPTRTITSTSFQGPQELAVDGGEIFTANDYSSTIQVIPANANGATTPTRSITGLSAPNELLVLGSELYVANESTASVLVYPRNATGAATPTRTITATGFATTIGIAAY